MVDVPEQFEMVDELGTTIIYKGLVGTTETIIDNSGKGLQDVIIKSDNGIYPSKNLQFRFSATDAWFSLGHNCILGWTPKETNQLRIRGVSADTAYEIIANWELN